MKFLEDHFDEYVAATKRFNLHPSLLKKYAKLPKNKMVNLIFYGPSGVGKYTQMLVAIKKYSPSELKYEKRMLITFNKEPVYIKMSDIHFEINMALLGCNSKLLWNEIYTQIIDVISTRPTMCGIIVCKNFHNIHGELLEVFYSYIRCSNPHIHASFVILTDNISFLPDNLVKCCEIIHVKRPSPAMYKKCILSFGAGADQPPQPQPPQPQPPQPQPLQQLSTQMIRSITNIKTLRVNYARGEPFSTVPAHAAICDSILANIVNPTAIVFLDFRDLLYDILIYDIDIYNCIWFIIGGVLRHLSLAPDRNIIRPRVFTDIMNNTYSFLHMYNNNYRPIYHLERFMFMLINHVRAHHSASEVSEPVSEPA
jgi:DNA polymerase III delta prime subunit